MDVYLLGEGFGSHDLHRICLERNVRVLGFADPGRPATLHAKAPALSLEEVAGRTFDLIVIANPHFDACRARLLELGVPASRILVFHQDIPAALERLGPLANFASRRRGQAGQYLVHALEGRCTADQRTGAYGPGEAALATRLLGLFLACQADLEGQDPLYAVGRNWGNFMRATRGDLYRAAAAGDPRTLHALLANFWRNDLGWGIIGGEEAFAGFCAMPDASYRPYIHRYLRTLAQSLEGDLDLDALALPPAGNPFGMAVDGRLVQENSIMNHHRASLLAGLLAPLEAPVVAEIGGGVGYFARALLKADPRVTYLDFDLPETLVVAAYVLATEFPDRKVLLYERGTPPLTPEVLAAYDIILMPTYMLPRLGDATVDLFVNTISFGEMSPAIVANYLRQIDRATRRFFYHENLCDLNFDLEAFDFENIATDFFQVPESFTRLFSAPSRWPFFGPDSPHHAFTENLYAKAGRLG